MSAEQDLPADEPKIVVDSDWKEQVAKEKQAEAAAAEKAAAEKDAAAGQPAGETQAAGSAAAETSRETAGAEPDREAAAAETDRETAGAEPDRSAQPPLPPASFEVLVSMLFSQAMAMLGQIPDPSTGQTQINKGYAKHTIDTLEVLKEKTQGNLTEEETKVVDEALHALRMAFVSVQG